MRTACHVSGGSECSIIGRDLKMWKCRQLRQSAFRARRSRVMVWLSSAWPPERVIRTRCFLQQRPFRKNKNTCCCIFACIRGRAVPANDVHLHFEAYSSCLISSRQVLRPRRSPHSSMEILYLFPTPERATRGGKPHKRYICLGKKNTRPLGGFQAIERKHQAIVV